MIYDYQERKQQCFTNSFSTVALAVIDNFNFNQMICLNKTLTSTLKKKATYFVSAIWQGLVLFYCTKNAASSSRLRKYPPRGTRFWSADLGPQKDETPTYSNHSLWAEATALGASRAWSPREGCKSISPHLLTWSADGPPGKRFPNSIKVAEKKWKSLSHSLRCFCHLGRGRTCLKKKGGHGGSFPFPGSYKAEEKLRFHKK